MRRPITVIALIALAAFPVLGAFPDICERCWYKVPNSNLSSVYQTPNPGPWGNQKPIMSAYNGAAFDVRRNRLIIAGAGGRRVCGQRSLCLRPGFPEMAAHQERRGHV